MSEKKKEPLDGEEQPEEVGYKKPPRHTRFKGGQSGNPSGRPKKKLQKFDEVVQKLLNEKTTLKEKDGTFRRLTMFEAMILGQIHSSIKGNTRAADFLKEGLDSSDKESGRDLPLIVKLLNSKLAKAEDEDEDDDDEED